ncbi:MAG TPA: isochorismatase family cysteine hydrolase [Verrucomicrobiae bacterium]|nr:isochorismatase family cysteine hydrolase [Verrucomicrobiae bacterium]
MATVRGRNADLHGNVPDASPIALILVDVINALDFPNNGYLLKRVPRLAKNIATLKTRCRERRIPAIYVNDNHDKWRSDRSILIAHARSANPVSRLLTEALLPQDDDYFILKPKHSAFYSTPLDAILSKLGTRTVILAGLTTSACILLTAGEVYVRDFKLFVPSDCVAGLNRPDHLKALSLMRTSFQADTRPYRKLNLRSLAS